MLRELRTAAVVAVAGALGLAGCSAEVSVGKKTVNTANAEKVIGSSLSKQLGSTVDVTCPKDVKAEKGATFRCTAKSGADTATVLVTQKDAEGNIRYRLQQG